MITAAQALWAKALFFSQKIDVRSPTILPQKSSLVLVSCSSAKKIPNHFYMIRSSFQPYLRRRKHIGVRLLIFQWRFNSLVTLWSSSGLVSSHTYLIFWPKSCKISDWALVTKSEFKILVRYWRLRKIWKNQAVNFAWIQEYPDWIELDFCFCFRCPFF